MRRIIAILLAFVFLFSFAACKKGETGTGIGETEKTEITGIGVTAKVTVTLDEKVVNGTYKNNAQIPSFSVDGESEAINAINNRINEELVTFANDMAKEPMLYAVIYTDTFDNGRYLEAISTYSAGFSIEAPKVASYVYDKVDDREVDLDLIYSTSGYSENDISKFVTSYYSDYGQVKNVDVEGFYITKTGIVEFFACISIDAYGSESTRLVTVIPELEEISELTDGKVSIKE